MDPSRRESRVPISFGQRPNQRLTLWGAAAASAGRGLSCLRPPDPAALAQSGGQRLVTAKRGTTPLRHPDDLLPVSDRAVDLSPHLRWRLVTTGLVTVGLVLCARRWQTVGGRVPMVFVALWFGAATMVALVFSHNLLRAPHPGPTAVGPGTLGWPGRMRVSAVALLPLALTPLLERAGVHGDPAVWLLDCALVIALCTVPYFTLLARSVLGGVVLSIGAFQALWTCGASGLFVLMQALEQRKTGQVPHGWTFEDFFRPEYRSLFYLLTAVMVLGYCPAMLYLGYRRFGRETDQARHAAV
jgi:hypothetical protein